MTRHDLLHKTRRVRRLSLLLAVAMILPAALRPVDASCVAQVKQPVTSGGTNGVTTIATADIDRDGHTDLVTGSFGDDKIAWYESDGGTPPTFNQQVISIDADSVARVIVADLDGDGDTDILSASSNDDKIAWYDNNGGDPPFFLERVVSSVADLALDVAVADVNGDGHLDILSASFEDDTIAWYRSNGAETPFFEEKRVTELADGASGVSAGDLDGDGDTDIAAASRLDGTIAWYENRGGEDPLFTRTVLDDQASGAARVRVTDLDGDGDMDIVALIPGADTVAWYENNSEAMAPPEPFTKRIIGVGAATAVDLDVSDIDGNGTPDVAVAVNFDETLAWFANDGGSPPAFTRTDVSTATAGINGVHIADVDDDGDTDLLSTAALAGLPAQGDRVSFWDSDGSMPPDFTERVVSMEAVIAEAVAIGDLDGDTDLDIVQVSSNDDRIAWFRNDGATLPTFLPITVTQNADGAKDVALADMDDDGFLDIVAASAGDGKIAWHRNDQADPPGFDEQVISTAAGSVQAISVADVDEDGDLDVLSASFDESKIAWHENDAGTFTENILPMPPADPKDEMSGPLYVGATSVALAHVDDDDNLDIVATFYDSDVLLWFPGDGEIDPAFGDPWEVSTFINGPRAVVAVDLDADGDTDLAVASELDNSIRWWENIGPPVEDDEGNLDPAPVAWTQRIVATLAFGASSLAAVDLDEDLDLDLISSLAGADQLVWYSNDGGSPPAFPGEQIDDSATSAQDIAAGDLDGDGDLDAAGAQAFEIAWYQTDVEQCQNYDASGDDRMDGVELAWIARAFGQSSSDPSIEWWFAVDYTGDGFIDGDDLAVLTSTGVWGLTTSECFFICNP